MTKPELSAEFTAFDSLVRQVLSVPREELKRREAEYKAEREAKPIRQGPKRKPEWMRKRKGSV